MTRWSGLRPRRFEIMEMTMLRLFGWMVAGGILLGSASIASAQDSQLPGNPALGSDYGYSGNNAYGDLAAPGVGISPLSALNYGIGGGYSVPAIGSHKECYTLYPLRAVYPYSYTGPGSRFGQYSYIPYPYIPVGYGWYGEWWRGW